jgi:hypothetical protein
LHLTGDFIEKTLKSGEAFPGIIGLVSPKHKHVDRFLDSLFPLQYPRVSIRLVKEAKKNRKNFARSETYLYSREVFEAHRALETLNIGRRGNELL